jgi:hypothetical protein
VSKARLDRAWAVCEDQVMVKPGSTSHVPSPRQPTGWRGFLIAVALFALLGTGVFLWLGNPADDSSAASPRTDSEAPRAETSPEQPSTEAPRGAATVRKAQVLDRDLVITPSTNPDPQPSAAQTPAQEIRDRSDAHHFRPVPVRRLTPRDRAQLPPPTRRMVELPGDAVPSANSSN